jgi:hypothetical protein
MSGLEFIDEAARQLEKAYLTRGVIAQRSETIRHLDLSPDERVLDIGCGPVSNRYLFKASKPPSRA